MYNNRNDMFYEERAGASEQQVALYLAKVMGWMCVGLLTTLATALFCLSVPSIRTAMFYGSVMYPVMILQLAVVVIMSAAVRKVGPGAATVMFMLYAALTGVTFTSLFYVFEMASLVYVFGITAFVFVAMAAYGFVTRKDLTRMGSLALFGLMGIIVAGIVNMFIGNGVVDLLITVVGIVLFIGLTAYDTQRIKDIYMGAVAAGIDDEHPEVRKMAIYGALTLYLDFINLFLKLLRLMGRRRS